MRRGRCSTVSTRWCWTRCATSRIPRISPWREALEVVARLAPRRAYLTHMTHDLGHRETSARLPAGVELAYDGLVIDVAVAPE